MSLRDEITEEVRQIFQKQWSVREGNVVPHEDSLGLGNDGVSIKAAVLYTDLADSTKLVTDKKTTFSAEVYKSFLRCACKIILNLEGTITAFDGDRVMGVFIGNYKNTNAVKAALKINWAVTNIVNVQLRDMYKNSDYVVHHGTGIDCGDLLIAQSGVRGSKDLVWVGPAANYAAKLCALRSDGFATWISRNVFDVLGDEAKYDLNKNIMWEARIWTTYNQTVYRSNHWWEI